MNKSEILKNTIDIVGGDRAQDYGTVKENMQHTANLMSAYLTMTTGEEITLQPHDVASLMILLKLARIKTSPHKADNWIDICGYGACGGECATE